MRNPLNFFIGMARYWLGTRRSALTTIHLIEQAGILPGTIIDAGCNDSQWAWRLARRWPAALVHSIDVQAGLRPIGNYVQCALSQFDGGMSPIKLDGKSSRVSDTGEVWVRNRRLDKLGLFLVGDVVLKIDCESSTYDALRGADGIMDAVACVNIEMLNSGYDGIENRQLDIALWLYDRGFRLMEIVDACVWPSRVYYADAVFMRKRHG